MWLTRLSSVAHSLSTHSQQQQTLAVQNSDWHRNQPQALVGQPPVSLRQLVGQLPMGQCIARQPADAHNQSVLTIALSEQDLAKAHKIWQQWRASAECVALPTDATEPAHYCLSHNNNGDVDVNGELPVCSCQEFLLQELAQVIQSAGSLKRQRDDDGKQPEAEIQLEQTASDWLEQLDTLEKGQTESKRHGAKVRLGNNANNGEQQTQTQTKGTAMSFGFRKKLNSTPKKLRKLLEGGGKQQLEADTKDDNGNAAASTPTPTPTPTPVHFEKVGAAASQKLEATTVKRFGYRPASTGLMGSEEAAAANLENNNCNNSSAGNGSGNGNGNGNAGGVLVSNLKRRSKSAHAGRSMANAANLTQGEPKIAQPKTLTFNLNQNTTIEYQRRQFFGDLPDASSLLVASSRSGARAQQRAHNYNNLASMHANVIVRPTSFAKFTLQTVSLPRPEYPVAISLSATTPTTPSSSVQSPVPQHAVHNTGARAKDTVSTAASRHPLTSIHAQPALRHLDQKSVKQLTNNTTRRGFSGSREISADSGIASMDMALDSSGSGTSSGTSGSGARRGAAPSPKRSRSRPRNLQMVMSGRHTFEVRSLDNSADADPPSSESSSFVETLALPKLPTDGNQSVPLPLVGLVRSSTVLSRESYELRRQQPQSQSEAAASTLLRRNGSEESESVDEEKLYLDSSTSEKSAKQQTSSCSSSSWCQAGESLAAKDFSSMSLTSSTDGKQQQQSENEIGASAEKDEDMSLGLEDMSLGNTEMQFSTLSSLTETATAAPKPSPLLKMHIVDNREAGLERPRSFNNALNESKFAELALASSQFLLDDETSPTDSLVSSNESSEEATGKIRKHKHNAELQEKDIDEISPELEVCSPISPGTPTHASHSHSHSLSLGSDCGNLIDDEIADQPALLFNSEEAGELSLAQQTDTPTLMETHTTGSMRSLKSQSKARTALQQAIELSLRTPAAVRKAVMERAESLDTLSPCESICSEDLMMDFDVNSSLDSIDRSASVRSRSGSDLRMLVEAEQLEETELFSELDRKGSSDVMKELNSLLRVRMQRSGARERISAHLPARATRLLNRSRLQDSQQRQQCASPGLHVDSDNSLRSTPSGAARKRSSAVSRASTASSASASASSSRQQQQQLPPSRHAELHSSSDDLMLHDKSFRNAMIQDVLQFKKQLLRLRRILQEEAAFDLKRTETLNPFDQDNLQLFAACGLDSKLLNDLDLTASLTSAEDPLLECSDLRRQVVCLQGQVDDRDRTIRLQRDLIEQLEAEKRQSCGGGGGGGGEVKDRISMATQTERTRPLAIGAEGLSRSKPEYTSYTTHFPMLHCNDSTVAATTIIRHQQKHPCNNNHNHNNNSRCQSLNQTRRHTIISTTLTNYNQQLAAASFPGTPRRASIAWDSTEAAPGAATTTGATTTATTTSPTPAYKPVRITLIGEPIQNGCQQNGVKARFANGCQSVKVKATNGGQPPHYQPLYNSNKMTNPTVTIV